MNGPSFDLILVIIVVAIAATFALLGLLRNLGVLAALGLSKKRGPSCACASPDSDSGCAGCPSASSGGQSKTAPATRQGTSTRVSGVVDLRTRKTPPDSN